MSSSAFAAFQEFQVGAMLPRLCGCLEWFAPWQPGTPELEGIVFRYGVATVDASRLPVCSRCVVKMLAGQKPFRRRGNVVEVRR